MDTAPATGDQLRVIRWHVRRHAGGTALEAQLRQRVRD